MPSVVVIMPVGLYDEINREMKAIEERHDPSGMRRTGTKCCEKCIMSTSETNDPNTIGEF